MSTDYEDDGEDRAIPASAAERFYRSASGNASPSYTLGMDDSTFRHIIRYESPFVLEQDKVYPTVYNNTHAIFANLDDANELRLVNAMARTLNRLSYRAQGDFGDTWIGVRNKIAADRNAYLESTRAKGGHERIQANTQRSVVEQHTVSAQGKKPSWYQKIRNIARS